jgi:precorrin-6Y C5,15-methyltransferase (decarboxylating)
MKEKILIFGGTTEGRELADALSRAGIPHVVSVATEYGKEIEQKSGEESLLVGRKNKDDIVSLLSKDEYSKVVDATHPFATLVSSEIKAACRETGTEYLRLKRPLDKWDEEGTIKVSSVTEASTVLEGIKGNILILTGSKDLKELLAGITDRSRVFARVLPSIESLNKCTEAGLSGRQIIAMQGPFSHDMNAALIKEIGASAILTKESGSSGGFEEKLSAARDLSVKCVVIANPEKEVAQDTDFCNSVNEVLVRLTAADRLKKPFDVEKEKGDDSKVTTTVALAGMGPGSSDFWTLEFLQALKDADIVFGAKTVLDELVGQDNGVGLDSSTKENKAVSKDITFVSEYDPEKVLGYLEEHPEFVNPLVVYSGDISLCSGAKKGEKFFLEKGFKVRKISGISSVALFANRLSLSLEETKVVSAHGRKCNVNGFARENEHLIVLPSGIEDAKNIIDSLDDGCSVTAGINLGAGVDKTSGADSLGEKVFEVTDTKELLNCQGKVLLYIHNPDATDRKINSGLRDSDITRGNVPMTKEDIRALSIRRLGLKKNSVLWDVGAGTGSISMEAALLDPTIDVYAVERKDEAVGLLEENKKKFGLGNVTIVKGLAPEALKDLPKPDSVFVGGSGGNLEDIIVAARSANPDASVVINCVTLETLAETVGVLDKKGITDADIIQVNVSSYEKKGSYHLADAQNPVYIISF